MTAHKHLAVILAVLLAGPAVFAAESPAAPPALVSQIKVQPDLAPDCSSLKAMAESVTRDCKTNDAKAIAIYNFMQLTHYHNAYPNEPGGLPVLKEISCYGWSLCGGLHVEQAALWNELGWNWRFVGWNGHTTVEAQYDDKWHYLDVFLKAYGWAPDGKGGMTIASEDDLTAKGCDLVTNGLVMDAMRNVACFKDDQIVNNEKINWRAPTLLVCGDTIKDVYVPGLKSHKVITGAAKSWQGINHADGGYSASVSLAPGFSLTSTWDLVPDAWFWGGKRQPPKHSCAAHKDTRNNPGIGLVLEPYINSKPARSYANGFLAFAPDFSSDACLKSFAAAENVKHSGKALVPAEGGKPAFVVVRLASPYILTQATGEALGADTVEVSVDEGKTYAAASLKDFGAAVKGKMSALVKVSFKEALKSLKLDMTVQNNSGALPYLSPGKNVVSVSVADPKALGENKLVVTYAYRLGWRTKPYEQLVKEGKEVAKQHNAVWSPDILYVQKTFSAKDLPAAFEVNCPTPKGKTPVYPRMMFVRREVLAPSSKPLPLPDGAVEAAAAAEGELLPLPNPFTVGAEPPAAK